MGWDYVSELRPKTDLLFFPQMIYEYAALVEWWYWQGKIEELGEKPVPVPLCPSQIPHGLTRARTRASAVGGRWLSEPWHSPSILLFLDLVSRWGRVVSVTPRPRFTLGGKDPGTQWTGGWVGLRAGLDTEARGKFLCLCRDRTPLVPSVARH
jgi:hypothetical protein